MKSEKPQPVQMRKSEDKFHVGTIPRIVVTRYRIPKYNRFTCKAGPHGDTKYNRCKTKK